MNALLTWLDKITDTTATGKPIPFDQETRWITFWMESNVGKFYFILLTVAIGLQQFEATEPAAGGFWWISVLATLAQSGINSAGMGGSPSHFKWSFFPHLLSIALQIYLLIYQWENLCNLDAGLKEFRVNLCDMLTFGTLKEHRIFGWILWAPFAYANLHGWRQRGTFWWYKENPSIYKM